MTNTQLVSFVKSIIREPLTEHGFTTSELASRLKISKSAANRHIARLIKDGELFYVGKKMVKAVDDTYRAVPAYADCKA